MSRMRIAVLLLFLLVAFVCLLVRAIYDETSKDFIQAAHVQAEAMEAQ